MVNVGVFDKVGVLVKVNVLVNVSVLVGVVVCVLVNVNVLVSVGVLVKVGVIVGVLVGIIAHEISILSTVAAHCSAPCPPAGKAVNELLGVLNTIIVEEEVAVNSNDLVAHPRLS